MITNVWATKNPLCITPSKLKNPVNLVDLLVTHTVIGSNVSEDLAKKLARKIKGKYIGSELRIFPDGEGKVTIKGKPKKGKILVVHSIPPPVDSNLIQALALVSKAKKYSSDVTVITPYLGYARQDREFLPGEVVTIKVIAKLFKSVGASKIIVVDIHSKIALNHFKIRSKNVSAIPELVKFFVKLKLKNPLVVSPDLGGAKRAESFAKIFKTKSISLKKHRDRKTGKVRIRTKNVKQVVGRDLILVDDMISSGSSIIKATNFLKRQKCGRVFVACTHGLLVNGAERKIKKAGVTQIVSTNTIPGKTALVDVSNRIAKALY